jgi:glycosyltransferase involved in cell wall biosynthesis
MTDRIRLAFVITELAVGGAEKCLVSLATRLDRERYEPAVYSLKARPPAGKDGLVRQLEAAGVPVTFLDLRSSWQFFGAVRRLAELLRQQQPPIVQTFLFHANVVGTLAARRAGVAKIVAGIRVADPRWWRAVVEKQVLRRADVTVCVSQSVAEFCRRHRYRRHVVIPNGVDLAAYQNAPPLDLTTLGLASGKRAILYVGRLDKQKGLVEFLRAAPRVLPGLREHDLLLVGDGPQRKELERLAKSLGISDRVHFAGWRADVPAILAAADMLVLPSRYEGMPNVVLEALAAGKPVVATRAEGVVELLGQAADRQTVALGKPDEMWAKIGEFAQFPQSLHELRNLNRFRAENEFSLPAVIAQYDRLYSVLACGNTHKKSQ